MITNMNTNIREQSGFRRKWLFVLMFV